MFLTVSVIAALLFIPAGGIAEDETLCTYRVRICAADGDRSAADGTLYVGDYKSRSCTVQLKLDETGKAGPGTGRNLRTLTGDTGAHVVRAVWRFETSDTQARNNLYEVYTAGKDGKAVHSIVTGKTADGWNVLDITEYIRQWMTDPKTEGVFRFRAANRGGRRGTWLDAGGSEVLVTIAYPSGSDIRDVQIADEPILDAALSALEESHIILRQYDEVSGSLLTAKWPLGVPYYYGGHSEEKVLRRFHPLQESNYYKSSRVYLCGFDCGAYLHWVEETAGYEPHDMLSTIGQKRNGYLPTKDIPLTAWWQVLKPGDMFVGDHGGFHIMMYIGTPRMYGLTAGDCPEIAGLLDAPLVIHCGENPFYYERYRDYIRENGWNDTYPPDGGVTVSFLLENENGAPHSIEAPWKKNKIFSYYDVRGTYITVQNIENYDRLIWFRPTRKEN